MARPDITMLIQPKTRSNWLSHAGAFIKKQTALTFCRKISLSVYTSHSQGAFAKLR